jgi:hypothetical protein
MRNTYIVYKDPVRFSHETYYVSAKKTNRLILFRETVAVYCENHTEYINNTVGKVQSYKVLKYLAHIVTTMV